MSANVKRQNLTDQQSETISDRESESNSLPRGRPAVPLEIVLTAADGLFTHAGSPRTVTMDAIAAAAGVGKGTLFRAFGSREGLLDALWVKKSTALRQAVEQGLPPLGPGGVARERVIAFLDALLTFKLENRYLIHSREVASVGLRQSKPYEWAHQLLTELITQATHAAKANRASYSAHVLLNALDIELIEDMLTTGLASSEIRCAQAALIRSIIDDARDT
jgi:AcrR family transcriptional regulator